MKKRLEAILVDYLKAELPAYAAMIVPGHTTNDRPKPYICVDVSQVKGHGDMPIEYGLLDATVSVAIADSAHDIEYAAQDDRLMDVVEKIEEFEYEGEDMILRALTSFDEADAKDENNIGNVATWTAIVQVLDWGKVRGQA